MVSVVSPSLIIVVENEEQYPALHDAKNTFKYYLVASCSRTSTETTRLPDGDKQTKFI